MNAMNVVAAGAEMLIMVLHPQAAPPPPHTYTHPLSFSCSELALFMAPQVF